MENGTKDVKLPINEDEIEQFFDIVKEAGIDIKKVYDDLLKEGIEAFKEAFDEILNELE